MTFLATARVNYPARLQRAELLASRYPFAKEILDFYRHVAAFQQDFYKQLRNRWGKQPVAPADGDLRSQLHVPLLIESFRSFLGVVERNGPDPLATHARHLRDQGTVNWTESLSEFWKTGLLESPELTPDAPAAGSQPFSEFLARAFLQPYAEFISGSMLPPVLPMTVSRCPLCNGLPLLGVLRPEGDGGKRFLQCSFCSQEWEFRRILCAHCGEDQEQKLAVYVAEEFPHIRVEVCESCRYFLRTIDLTKDGNAAPLVDDLAAIPLGLWTHEHGYQRIQENLLHT
jgi:Protein involved in formate dehydrogenase formation